MKDINDGVLIDRLNLGGGYYYIGEVKDGAANGKGSIYNPDDSISRQGTFKDGELNGYGEIFVDGEKIYDGFFVNGERSGRGAQYAMGILQYEGDFLHDMRHGKGTQWWPMDHSRYEGDFKEDKRTGKGILYIDEKKRYEGDFLDGKFHGDGIFYDEHGNVARKGKFENNDIAYERAPLKGNKWVSISQEDGITFAESYKLIFNLPPQIEGIKDTLELYVRYTDNRSDKVSTLGIYSHFSSKGSAFVLGGHPAGLRRGKMTIKLNDGESITIDPIEVSTEIDKNGNVGVDETVAYPIEKDVLKKICDSDSISIQLTGDYKEWEQTLTGEDIICLLRASWNGIFNTNDYTAYLQSSPIVKKNKKAVIVNSCIWIGLGIITYFALEDAGEDGSILYALILVGIGIYGFIKKKTGIAKYFIK